MSSVWAEPNKKKTHSDFWADHGSLEPCNFHSISHFWGTCVLNCELWVFFVGWDVIFTFWGMLIVNNVLVWISKFITLELYRIFLIISKYPFVGLNFELAIITLSLYLTPNSYCTSVVSTSPSFNSPSQLLTIQLPPPPLLWALKEAGCNGTGFLTIPNSNYKWTLWE
jgi:hypothetical protein